MKGIFTGGSGGGCVSAALRVARELPAGSFVVAFLPDTGMRYLSKVYSDEWMRERGYLESEVPLKAEDVVAAKHRSGKVRELIMVGPDQTVFHALRTMQEQDISQLPVFEEGGHRRHDLRRPDSESGAAGQRPAQADHPRGHEQAAAAGAARRAGRTRHPYSEPRRARQFLW